jgi:tRNA threonylcarbamoyl adenosine modification protein YjeE
VSVGLSEPGLIALAGRLAGTLPPGSVVWLEGPLGAGKTTFARALLAARGATLPATSPTFNLVHHHEGPRGAAYHVDCYRLRDPEEAAELDWDTMQHGDLLLVEWPERAGPWVPPATVRVTLGYAQDPDARTVRIEPEIP